MVDIERSLPTLMDRFEGYSGLITPKPIKLCQQHQQQHQQHQQHQQQHQQQQQQHQQHQQHQQREQEHQQQNQDFKSNSLHEGELVRHLQPLELFSKSNLAMSMAMGDEKPYFKDTDIHLLKKQDYCTCQPLQESEASGKTEPVFKEARKRKISNMCIDLESELRQQLKEFSSCDSTSIEDNCHYYYYTLESQDKQILSNLIIQPPNSRQEHNESIRKSSFYGTPPSRLSNPLGLYCRSDFQGNQGYSRATVPTLSSSSSPLTLSSLNHLDQETHQDTNETESEHILSLLTSSQFEAFEPFPSLFTFEIDDEDILI